MVVAGLGSALGILAGLVPAVGVVTASSNISLQLPWSTLGLAAVGVPVGAALLAAAVTRSRLPVERRLA